MTRELVVPTRRMLLLPAREGKGVYGGSYTHDHRRLFIKSAGASTNEGMLRGRDGQPEESIAECGKFFHPSLSLP